MTSDIQKRLSGRINLLSDFNITVDYENDMIYTHYDKELCTSITQVKHMSKPQFSTYLNEVTEAYLNHNSK